MKNDSVKCTICPVCDASTNDAMEYPYHRNEANIHLPRSSSCFDGTSVFVCQSCKTGFTAQVLKNEEIDSYYAKMYESITQEAKKSLAHTAFPELNARFLSQCFFLKSFVDLKDGIKILEIGSSSAGALPALSLFCRPRYFYFDNIESKIIKSYGGERLGNFATEAELRKKIPPASIDLIYMSHSLEHINPIELGSFLSAIVKILTPGGVFFAEVPDELPAEGETSFMAPHTLFFNASSLEKLFSRFGLTPKIISQFGVPTAKTHAAILQAPCEGHNVRRSLKLRAIESAVGRKIVRWVLYDRLVRGAFRNLRTPYSPIPYLRIIGVKE